MNFIHTFHGRLLLTFISFAILMGLGMGTAGYIAGNTLGEHVVARQAAMMIKTLIEAEMASLENRDRGGTDSIEAGELANAMDWKFYVGKQLPPEWLSMAPGIHFQHNSNTFILLEKKYGISFALAGNLGEYATVQYRLTFFLGLCAFVGVLCAVALALYLSGKLTTPLKALTEAASQDEKNFISSTTELSMPQSLATRQDEIGALARSLARRDQKIMAFMERETCFTGDVSHELRSPLTVLHGALEILEGRLDNIDVKTGILLERMQRTVNDMEHLLETLLCLSRSPGQPELRECNVSEIIKDLLQKIRTKNAMMSKTLTSSSSQTLVKMHINPQIILYTKPSLAEIVFQNLLENAFRYSSDGNIEVMLENNTFETRNMGAMPADIDIFARGTAGKASLGYGLGLAIATRACENLGWKIEYTHREGKNIFRVLFK